MPRSTLSPAQVQQLLRRLQPALKVKDFAQLERISALLDGQGQCTVAQVMQACFADSTDAAATKAFERLRATVSKAAEQQGVALSLEVDANKQLGDRRWVTFVGEVPVSFHMLTEELDAAQRTKLIDQQGIPLYAEGLPHIMVITAVANERTALYQQFSPGRMPANVERDGFSYDDFGQIGNYRLLHINCPMGAIGAARRVDKAISTWRPVLVVALGMAFGAKDDDNDPQRQQLGEVLVATHVKGYELQRINTRSAPQLRDLVWQPAESWLQKLSHLDGLCRHAADDAPRLHFGTVLSGQKLVDNRKFRDRLTKLTGGDAIGGEMEGIGVAEACHGASVGWILLKGIADWGDGNKPSGDIKTEIQVQASANAAWVLHALLDRRLIDTPRSPRGGKRLARPDVRDYANIAHVLENHGRRVALDADQLSAERIDEAGVNAFEQLLRWVNDAGSSAYFALLGEYGMGKTVLCQRLCQHLEQQRERGEHVPRPLYFDLRRITGLRVQAIDPHSGEPIWRDRVPTLDETLSECVGRGWLAAADAAPPSVMQLKQWVLEGALVIFDGLDEVLVHLTEANGLQYTHQLLKLLDLPRESPSRQAATAPKPKLLVSCRSHFFKSLAHQRSALTERGRSNLDAQRFEALLLLPFSETQIADYLRSALPSLDVEQAMATIRAVHNIGELAARPYLLKEVARMLPRIEQWRLQGRKVQGVSVYREMVSEWLQRDQGKHQIQPAHKLLVARDLAAELWRRGARLIDANDLSSWYGAWRHAQSDRQLRYAQMDADKLDEDLRNSQFLVRKDGEADADSGFRFAHSSLLEFFLAEYLAQAVRDDAPERWAMPVPSRETLDFFGQLLVEASDQADVLRTLNRWRAPYRAQTSELLLHYALRAHAAGWPLPVLHGMDLRGAVLNRLHIGRDPQPGEPRLSLESAHFAGAHLRQTVFRSLRLNQADFSGAQLQSAEFHDCLLDGADFAGSDLSGAIFRRCRLDGAQFADATGYRCQFVHSGETPPTLAGALQVPQPGRVAPVGAHVAWLSGGDGGIKACVFVDDGRTLLTFSIDGTLRHWDARSGECLRAWQGPQSMGVACAFAPDGRLLVSGGKDGRMRLWDGESGACLRAWEGRQGEVFACAFAPDGHSLVSGGADGSLRFWDSESGACLRVWQGPQAVAKACAYSPDGRSLAVGSGDGMLRLWDVASGECLRAWQAHQGWLGACAFSPDGRALISAGGDSLLRRWDVETGECLHIWRGGRFGITACAFAPDGRVLATDSVFDGHLRLMDSETGECLCVWHGHPRSFQHCAFAPDGRSLVSGGRDGVIRRWDAESGDCLCVLTVGNDQIRALAADGRSLVSSGGDGSFRLWDSESGECLRVWQADQGQGWIGVYTLDSRMLAFGGIDGWLRLWDGTSGECLRVWQGHHEHVFALALANDGRSLLSGGGRLLSGGESLWSDGGDCSLRLWDAQSGACRHVLQGHRGPVLTCAFAPGGIFLASGAADGTLRLWDSESGRCLRVLKGHRGPVSACAIAPDGRALVSTGRDFSLRLWDAHSGQCLRVLQGHQGGVRACAFSPDGSRLLSASDDGTLRLWDPQSGECLLVLCADETGTAAWRPQPIGEDGRDEPKRLLHATGEMWRHLAWLVPDDSGALQRLPLETFGDVVQP